MRKTSPLKLKFLGVRGSRPLHDKQYIKTGGNSTSLEILGVENLKLFIDCGTGLANHLFKTTQNEQHHPTAKNYHILITHTHWDHILTIPYLPILYDSNATISFYSATGSNGKFSDLFNNLFQFGHAGINLQQIKAKIVFHEVSPKVPFLIEDKVRVEGFQVNHPAITLGYKVSYGLSSLAVITDAAPFTGKNYLGDGMKDKVQAVGSESFEKNYFQELIAFTNGVNLLVYDTHFNDQNSKPDWGHSTPSAAIEICKAAGIKRLFMFHHSPEDDDTLIEKKLFDALHKAQGLNIEIHNAVEEEEWLVKSA